jgi:ligand-binding sensor domain-containing protein/signal transduction histidine kinase
MRKLYCLWILLSLSCFGYAQNKSLSFDYLTMEDGLPENRILALLQDRQGYIWIGTQSGLVRYDGYETRVYGFQPNFPKEVLINSVWSLHQDRSGILWAGTLNDGLFWYDKAGDTFIPASLNQKYRQNPFAGEAISQIQEDNVGNIFFITFNWNNGKHSLYAYNLSTKDLQNFSNTQTGKGKIEANFFYKIIKDSNGQIWVGTDNGLHRYNGTKGSFTGFFTNSDSLKRKDVEVLYEAPSEPGILWLEDWNKRLGSHGLIRLDTRHNKVQYFKRPKNKAGLSSDTILTVFEDHFNRLWVGTTNGLSLVNRKNGLITPYVPSDLPNRRVPLYNWFIDLYKEFIGQNSIFHIKADPEGNLWLISGKGLLYFNPQTGIFDRYTAQENNPEGLQTEYFFLPPLIDRAGTLWLGSHDGGLVRLDNQRSPYQLLKQAEENPLSYPGGGVTGIAPGKEGVYWLATQKGLVGWNKPKNEFKSIPLTKEAEAIEGRYAVAVDKEGLVWCSNGINNGLYQYNPKTGVVKNFRNKPKDKTSLSTNRITKLLVDHQGQLWVGTWGGGLCKFVPSSNTFIRYPYTENPGRDKNKSDSLDNPNVISLFEDRQGTIWVGTDSGGLNRFHPATGAFTSYFNPANGFTTIMAMLQDKAGRYWAGTYLGGMFLFNPQTGETKRFTEQDGLLSNNVMDIKEDNTGNIWIASQRGLSKFNPQNQTFAHFTKANGLPEAQFNRDGIKTEAGEFILSTQSGLLVFNPDDIKPNKVPPTTILQTVSYPNLYRKENEALERTVIIATQKEIELKHNENRVTFNYVGLHYDNAALNKYAYKLEGSDPDWVPAGSLRSTTYTNLSPGTYTFRVKAANADGVWDEKGTSFNLTILPPWWHTWWAYALYALLSGLALRTYVVHRSRALRRENQELESKVISRTTELSKANAALGAQRDQLSQTLTELKTTQTQLIQSEKMASLGELTAGIAHEIQNPLNFVNNFSEVNKELIGEMKQELKAGNGDEVLAIAEVLEQNLGKINHHGQRADSIVKGMLQHSRTSAGQKEPTDINALADEYLRLSYSGFRAKSKDFSCTLETAYGQSPDKVEVVPQELGRVLLNLFNNAFYAVQQKQKLGLVGYAPKVAISTATRNGKAEIRVRDNGTGIAESVKGKIFQPFFTTKPTGQGTGLGLSLSYDIVMKGHGGELSVASEQGEWAEFTITLPSVPAARNPTLHTAPH